MHMIPAAGQPAPGFTLYDSDKNPVKLEDFKGKKVVLLFFPLAFTSVCTKELCHVRDNIVLFNNINAVILGISVDSLYALGRFKAEQGLNFTLLSDFNKEVSQAYGAFYDTFSYGMKGVSKRAVFVIDGEGILRHEEVLENAGALPDFMAVESALKAI
jgi:peroxiredoxin